MAPTSDGTMAVVLSDPQQLTVVLKDGDSGVEVPMQIRRFSKFRILINAAGSRFATSDNSSVSLHYDDVELHPEETPEMLALKNGAIIRVSRKAGLGKTDTNGTPTLPTTRRMLPGLEVRKLAWLCRSCGLEHPVTAEEIAASPLRSCTRCGWHGHPSVRQRVSAAEEQAWVPRPAPSRHRVIATSGDLLEADFPGQHLEAPLPALLALVSQVQRQRLSAAFLNYLLFCTTFIVIMALARPVHQMFEIHSALENNLVAKAPSALLFAGNVSDLAVPLREVTSWESFWPWVDGVLVESIFGGDSAGSDAAGAGSLTVGRYNRVASAIRFRQVRVRPTLPRCPRSEEGYPSALDLACLEYGDRDPGSCATKEENHEFSRPCWGEWSVDGQDTGYPSKLQAQTAGAGSRNPAVPQEDLFCLQNCEALLAEGKRTAEEHAPFGLEGSLDWTLQFERTTKTSAAALRGCQAACNATGSVLLGDMSSLPGGFCGQHPDSGDTSWALGQQDCAGDVVDVPLRSLATARTLVAAMKRERWASEGTRALAIDFNTYNANYDLATVMRVMVLQRIGGRVEASVVFQSFRLDLFASSGDSLRLALEIVFLFWLLYYLVVELSEMYCNRWAYLSDFWNYIELANLAVYIYFMVSWLTYQVVSRQELLSLRSRSVDAYRDVAGLAAGFNAVELVSFNLVCGCVRFTKYFRMRLKFKMLWDALALSTLRCLPAVASYGLMILAFATSGHWLFGGHVEAFSTWPKALLTMTLAVSQGLETQGLRAVAPVQADVFCALWLCGSRLIAAALMLSVVIVSYSIVREKAAKQEAAEAEGQELGLEMPPLFQSWLFNNCPAGLVKRGTTDRSSAEMQENLADLSEALREVDLEALWSRLLEGALVDEVALDAGELRFLFAGDTKAARHWIHRVCKLADVNRVEALVVKPVLEHLRETEGSFETLSDSVQAFYGAILESFPGAKKRAEINASLLDSPGRDEDKVMAADDSGSDEDGPSFPEKWNPLVDPAQSVLMGSRKSRRPRTEDKNRRRLPNKMFKGGVGPLPPQKGQLRDASQQLQNLRRQGADLPPSTERDEWLHEVNDISGRRSTIAAFSQSARLRRL
eukprot:TRINITY_DN11022_c1_g2_i1.p1 TRINITY_DN11022_c1_g2~~TRINITY_DN11022_c1_g2_i1.p1  ORF type:complete len:1103 (-),score=240.63 TRINITY_DN11022_c1_g2_i1:366-3674(-)